MARSTFLEGDLLGTIGAFMHRQNGSSGSDQDKFVSNAKFTDWHTVALEWLPNRLQVFLDGVALKTDKGADRVTSRTSKHVCSRAGRSRLYLP
jgi:hypothetical protein